MKRSFLIRFLRSLCSGRIRGGTRLAILIAKRSRYLQELCINIPGGNICIDLRHAGGRSAIVQSAKSLSDEHKVLQMVVRSGDTVFDIGANVGYLAVWLAYLIGEKGFLHAFEPNSSHVDGLRSTLGQFANSKVWNIALADKAGTAEFFVPGDDTMASLRDWTENEHGAVARVTCEVATLDSLVQDGSLPRPDVLKCDIEGAELLCFVGGKSVLNHEDAPIIFFEANVNTSRGFNDSVSSAMDFLASLERATFSFYVLSAGARLVQIHTVDFAHVNILAVPANRLDRLKLDGN